MVINRKKLGVLALIALILIILIGIFIKVYIFRKADVSVASKKADVEISAGDLAASFESDEKAANAKYLSKIILVKGVVESISESKSDTASQVSVYLKEKGSTAGVMCSFDKTTFPKDKIKQGQTVYIKGICDGYLMDVVLNKCAMNE